MSSNINIGFILAAGRGTRMRELTEACPKPLIQVKGKALIDYNVERLLAAHIKTIYVNLFYKGEMIRSHLEKKYPHIDFHFIEDYMPGLETGGGVFQILPELTQRAPDGFFVLNSDMVLEESTPLSLERLQQHWNPQEMDVLLLFQPVEMLYPQGQDGNYFLENNLPRRQKPKERNIPFLFAGTQILHPRAFRNAPQGPFSLRDIYDQAEKQHKLGYVIHQKRLFHVGTPEAVKIAEKLL